MGHAIRGRLLSAEFAQNVLPSLPGVIPPTLACDRLLEDVGERAGSDLGPASSARAVADVVALPLLRALELTVLRRVDSRDNIELQAGGTGPAIVPVVIRAWSDDLDLVWREVVQRGIASEARWCLAVNGRVVRVVDAQRTWSRSFLEVDIAALAHDSGARQTLWRIANNLAITGIPAVLDTATTASAEHGTRVCRLLGDGVTKALGLLFESVEPQNRRRPAESHLLEECLTVIYRVLFLLFAEARGLVPVWHSWYRDRYTIGAIVTTLLQGRRYRGVWRAVQAISHMAHAGCEAGTLSVTAFNGRLFSPSHTTGIERRVISDAVMSDVILGLSTTRVPTGMVRTRYEELDVEQLGSVYEHVLEFQPTSLGTSLVRNRDARKATGTFYTPRQIAASLIEHTLEPLVDGRSAEQILSLRILDPAMGSGAFLVAACRFLARRAEAALLADGTWHVGDVTDADRVRLRREIVQRCLYGVDLNPVAVQLARLSLWLVALASDKPLTFLDHHLVVGNSLVGATPSDIYRETGGARRGLRHERGAPLFDDAQLAITLADAGELRTAMALLPDDSAADVRSKERQLAALHHHQTTLGAWKRVLDLWCATWFWDGANPPPSRATVADAASRVLAGTSALSATLVTDLFTRADACARREEFFHWPIVFPEVFPHTTGSAAESTGFDAVVGNPPWDMVRGDSGDATARIARQSNARQLTRFVRESGIYRAEARAHINRYALFTERALQLVRRGGRIGLVLPSGVLSDAGTASLREQLFSRAAVDQVVGMDNRGGIFPVHRGLKFALLTATAGVPTEQIHCSFGVSVLDRLDAAWHTSSGVVMTRAFITRASGGDNLGIPELAAAEDFRIVETVTASVPTLSDLRGWNARFGRELNASDDRGLMVPPTGRAGERPIIEGKMLSPFKVRMTDSRQVLAPDVKGRSTISNRARLAYREVASSSNRLTLIAAIVPAHAVTTHTVFCLKTSLSADAQHVLCALLNSFVANYLVRLRVSTHVTATIMARLRVPLVPPHTEAFAALRIGAASLANCDGDTDAHPAFAQLQATVAGLYRLTVDEFSHILSTFPLVSATVRASCLDAFRAGH